MSGLEFTNIDGLRVLTSFRNIVKMKTDRLENLKIDILVICFYDPMGRNEVIEDEAEKVRVWNAYKAWIDPVRVPPPEC